MPLLGVDELFSKWDAFGKAVREKLDLQLQQEMEKAQREMADLVPVDTGQGRATLMLPEALKRDVSPDSGRSRWRLGMLTKKIRASKKKGGAAHLYWVEFGTKKHARGEEVTAPKRLKRSKSGRLSKGQKRRKRGSPPRPAQPWFRPARQHLMERLKSRGIQFRAIESAKAATGLNEGKS